MKQQTDAPPDYPTRAAVGDAYDWDGGDYEPTEYHLALLNKPSDELPVWADPMMVDADVVGQRLTHMHSSGKVSELCSLDDANKRYRNPRGKTGIQGRGSLGRWGPNHAADVMVTRNDPASGRKQILLCTKQVGDSGSALCYPAGMVEPGDDVPMTLRKELTEEAVTDSPAVEKLFSEGRKAVVYRGFVDDWRNTDHAWIETTAVWFHADDEVGPALELNTKDKEEIKKVAWYFLDEVTSMYASHEQWLPLLRAAMAEDDATACGKRGIEVSAIVVVGALLLLARIFH